MKLNLFYCVLVLLLFVIAGCEKPVHPEIEYIVTAPEGGMFILNEGNFGRSNASLGYYDVKAATRTDNVFLAANNRPLGDVLNSMTIYDGKAYLVINNSQKIEVIDPVTFKSTGEIKGFKSPRHLLGTPLNKAYVSDYYDNRIAVIDMSLQQVVKYIPMVSGTEEMAYINGKVYICNTTGNCVYIISAHTDQLIDSIVLSFGPNSIKIDKNNKLWVLCSGRTDLPDPIKSGIYRIDPSVDTVESDYKTFPPDGIFGANKLQINGTRDVLYWLNKDVARMPINATEVPATAYIRANLVTYYGIGVDPKTEELYLSDAVDYVQRSVVHRYDVGGIDRGHFLGGYLTNGFYFNYR